MAPSEMVQASEVQIYERTLYKVEKPCSCTPPRNCIPVPDVNTESSVPVASRQHCSYDFG